MRSGGTAAKNDVNTFLAAPLAAFHAAIKRFLNLLIEKQYYRSVTMVKISITAARTMDGAVSSPRSFPAALQMA